ncbi:MAG: phosphatidate cytidylyltransferase [Opitutales bacterium]
MRHRAFSTIGLWTVVGLVVWVGGMFSVAEQAAFLLLATLILLAQHEFYRLADRIPGTRRSGSGGLLAGAALLFGLFFLAPERLRYSHALNFAALAFGVHLLLMLRRPTETPALLRTLPALYGFLYLPFMLSSLVGIARMEDGAMLARQPVGLYYVLWVVVATKFTDVGGLLVGVPFGRHKIAPEISPAKSWEGCAGGLLLSALSSAAFAWLCSGPLGLSFMVPWKAAVLALPLAALSIPSDLAESVFKRQAGAKDSGSTIPGIGGALDLVDSLVITGPAAMLLLSYFLEWAKRS